MNVLRPLLVREGVTLWEQLFSSYGNYQLILDILPSLYIVIDDMVNQILKQTILFADITDSTRLYEKLGNTGARRLCANSISVIGQIVMSHHGKVIKTMGDGLMAAFDDVQKSYDAAVAIQEFHADKRLSVTVGFHHGPVLVENNDIFGDTVNVAAKITSKAKAGEILLSQEVFDSLPIYYQMTIRLLDCVRLKGKNKPVNIYTVIYDQQEATICTAISPLINSPGKPVSLLISCNDVRHMIYPAEHKLFRLGRDEKNDCVSFSPYASRIHAVIEFERDRFIVTDQSTNGTFVNGSGGNTFFLKRESAPLVGEGIISLGQKPLVHNPALLHNQHFIYYSNKYQAE